MQAQLNLPVATNPAFAVLHLILLRFDMEKIRLKAPLKPHHLQCLIKLFDFKRVFYVGFSGLCTSPRRQEWFAD